MNQQLKDNTAAFMTAILTELDQDDAAAMLGFLTKLIESSPGKLHTIATRFKDPKVLADFQTVMNTKSKTVMMAKGMTLVQKMFK